MHPWSATGAPERHRVPPRLFSTKYVLITSARTSWLAECVTWVPGD
uniref:Uncharacterized protein n=1 Tax=Physcomitrium patens TaxID=3218 RepID=A0A2K1KFS2_PHYPA|nr:hypothetical protein PHYPA_008989 [Physcomitrium patens]